MGPTHTHTQTSTRTLLWHRISSPKVMELVANVIAALHVLSAIVVTSVALLRFQGLRLALPTGS